LAGSKAYRDLFDRDVPVRLQRDTVVAIQEAYRDSRDYCFDRYPEPVAHDLWPHERRAMVETNWQMLASRHTGVIAPFRPNRIGNAFHAQVRVGEMILTTSFVDAPTKLVRSAEFRNSLARSSQMTLPTFPEVPPPMREFLYGLIIHGGDEVDPRVPGFIHVVFPASDCLSYVGRIDLLDRFSDLIAIEPSAPEQPVQDRALPAIKRKRGEMSGT